MTSSVATGSRKPINFGSENGVFLRLDITSYATNGESVTAAILGLETSATPRIISALPAEPAQATDVYFIHDRANNKLKAHVASTGLEVANATDLGEVSILAIQG